MIQPLSTLTARVLMADKSDPAFGSLIPIAKKISPFAILGKKNTLCSSVPNLRKSGPDCLSANQCPATGAPADTNSSVTTYLSSELLSRHHTSSAKSSQ